VNRAALLPALVLTLVLCAGGAQLATAQSEDSAPSRRPGREVSLPPSEVRDTFFAYVLGIVLRGVEVDIDNAEMRAILTEFKSKLNVPFDLVTRVIQHSDEDSGERTISLFFNGAVDIPIPFSLLGYHPGILRSTEEVDFRVNRSLYTDPKNPTIATLVYDLSLSGGNVLVDVDDWICYLLGNLFDKIEVRHIVFFNYEGKWIGLLEGRGRTWGKNMREYFDFTHNGIIFPVPIRLDAMGAEMVGAAATSTAQVSDPASP